MTKHQSPYHRSTHKILCVFSITEERDGSRSPRSLMVDMTDGTTLLRNRRHMRSTGETNILPYNGQPPTVNVESSSPVDNTSPPVSSPPQSPAPKPEEPPSPTLRRSSRRSKPPEKLNLALNLCPRQLKLKTNNELFASVSKASVYYLSELHFSSLLNLLKRLAIRFERHCLAH